MASLLDNDPNPEARAQALAEIRDAYVWDHAFLDPLPMLKIPHSGKHPGILEFLAASIEGELPEEERPDDDMPKERLEATAPGVAVIEKDEFFARFGHGFLAAIMGWKINDPSDYIELIKGLPKPKNLEGAATYEADWDSDRTFAWQRLAGPNPVVIERPTAERWAQINQKMALTEAAWSQALGDGSPTIDECVAAGTLFVTDYEFLVDPTPVPCGELEGREKYLPVPIAAYWYNARLEQLQPVAIRLGQTPEAHLVVSDNSDRWLAAKAEVGVADFNYHEMGTHLSLVHFLQEGFAVATFRSLPPQHPVTVLLRAHFKYLLYNNFAGRELLVNPGGFVEKILSGELESGSMALVKRAYKRFHFDDLNLPKALDKRNMRSTEGLPVYPYRDDGLEIWAALETWGRAYVDAYYDDDLTVEKDPELQRWCDEMTSPTAAHVKGFPASFTTRAGLAETLTRLMFLASAQHAAVNYPQAHSMLVVPNMPGASYASHPSEIMEVLPQEKGAHAQIEAIWLLTCYQYGRLGQYGDHLTDAVVQPGMHALHKELDAIEARIIERNKNERSDYPYPYLLPSRIPNSSNI